MPRRKVLYICHNHSSVRPGGVETYTSELYEAIRASGEFEPILLARTEVASPAGLYSHAGTPFRPINEDPNQYFFETKTSEYDYFYMTSHDKDIYSRFFHEFLLAHRPDVVHFQHAVSLGFDLIFEIKKTLPHVPIVYTFQEFLPICYNFGQMVRTQDQQLCLEASPGQCHQCFPEIKAEHFFMRKRFIQSYLAHVDLFLAPSRFLLERYVEWGIPREKTRYEEYGRLPVQLIEKTEERQPRNRVGYFGQLSAFKGLDVLLKAMRLLSEGQSADKGSPALGRSGHSSQDRNKHPTNGHCHPHLYVHGANLDVQPKAFQDNFRDLLESTRANVVFIGRYDQAELPRLMANIDWVVVPSIWWENSPLVIQEAFLHGRPVICSDIGGMAEKVTDRVNGLHFRRGDPVSLAEAICQATTSSDLWDTLRRGIPEVHRMEHHVATLSDAYRSLLDGRRVPE
jgi:glycosyltransferase involved in cell wall biosynthesis